MEKLDDMEYEKSVLDLFGYYIEGPYESNKYKIYDKDSNEIGFIQYKKMQKKNVKKKIPEAYGYEMQIESDRVSLKNRNVSQTSAMIKFDLKNENGTRDFVELYFFPNIAYLSVSSNEYGRMNIEIKEDGSFSFNLATLFKNYFVKESVSVIQKNSNMYSKKTYTYNAEICDKDEYYKFTNPFTEKSMTLSIKEDENNVLYVSENYDRINNPTISTVEGNLIDAIILHGDGIEAFSHLRYRLNKLLPFNEEVIKKLCKNFNISKELEVFISGLDENYSLTLNNQ